jgi:hypothetical protein
MFLIAHIILKSGHEPLTYFTFLDLIICLGCVVIIYISYIIFKSIWLDIQPNVWFTFFNIFYGIVSLAFFDSAHLDVLVLANVCFFNFWINCVFIFLYYWGERPFTKSDFEKIKDRLSESYYSQDYFNLIDFWKHNFQQRAKTKQINKVWEYPFLISGSFYTLIRTRLLLVQNLYVVRATILLFLGDPFWLLAYLVPMFLLTAFFAIPSVQIYFRGMYGADCLKKLGWNAFGVATKTVTPTVIRGILGISGAAVFGQALDECISPGLNERQFDHEQKFFKKADQLWLEHQRGPRPIGPDHNKIVQQRRIPMIIDNFGRVVHIVFKDK